MKKLFIILAMIFVFCSCTTDKQTDIPQKPDEQEEDVPVLNGFSPEFKPSDFETTDEYYEAFLDEYVKNLEPREFFETEKEYPEVILEIFDIIMEEETLDFLKCKELLQIEVFGDENEFYTKYFYVTNEGAEEVLSIRVGKAEDGRYGLLLRGGGAPGGHGLERTDITIDDIKILMSEEERLLFLATAVDSVHWTGRTGETWGVYKGFADPTEISSEGLLNFFFNYANPDDFYDEATGTYCFSEDDVCGMLSEYFTDFDFIAEESGKDSTDGKFILNGFLGFDLLKSQRIIDEYFFDEETGIISVKGSTMDIDDSSIPTGDTFSMEVLVKDGKYLIKSFFYTAAEK